MREKISLNRLPVRQSGRPLNPSNAVHPALFVFIAAWKPVQTAFPGCTKKAPCSCKRSARESRKAGKQAKKWQAKREAEDKMLLRFNSGWIDFNLFSALVCETVYFRHEIFIRPPGSTKMMDKIPFFENEQWKQPLASMLIFESPGKKQ